MASAMFYLIGIIAFWQLLNSMRYMYVVWRQSPFLYIFPTKRNRSLPEFHHMWRLLGAFFGLFVLIIVWYALAIEGF